LLQSGVGQSLIGSVAAQILSLFGSPQNAPGFNPNPGGGQPIGGSNTTNIYVQNPITGVQEIPNMMGHINALTGSPY